MTIHFIGYVITLVLPASRAMFTFKKNYLKFYLLSYIVSECQQYREAATKEVNDAKIDVFGESFFSLMFLL